LETSNGFVIVRGCHSQHQQLSNEESLMEIEQQQDVTTVNNSPANTRLLLTHALRQLANISAENDRRHGVMQQQLATLTENITRIVATLPSTEPVPPPNFAYLVVRRFDFRAELLYVCFISIVAAQ
jgi:hypothetical protein